jgi:tocopherol cyclase
MIFLQVELEATTDDPGTTLRAPTSEAGLSQACKDTCFGLLKLKLWERRYDGSKGKVFSNSNTKIVHILGIF